MKEKQPKPKIWKERTKTDFPPSFAWHSLHKIILSFQPKYVQKAQWYGPRLIDGQEDEIL